MDVVVSDDGKFVYASSQLDNAIATFKRNGSGDLTPLGCIEVSGGADACAQSSVGLVAPDALTITSDGEHMVVGALEALTLLPRSPSSGLLSPGYCLESKGGSALHSCNAQAGFSIKTITGIALTPGSNAGWSADPELSTLGRFAISGDALFASGTCIDGTGLAATNDCNESFTFLRGPRSIIIGRKTMWVGNQNGGPLGLARLPIGGLSDPVSTSNSSQDVSGDLVSDSRSGAIYTSGSASVARTVGKPGDKKLRTVDCFADVAVPREGCRSAPGLSGGQPKVVLSPDRKYLYVAAFQDAAVTTIRVR